MADAPRAGSILAADLGGSNVRIGLFAPDRALDLQDVASYECRRYGDLESILDEDLRSRAVRAERVVLAVAGPVRSGVAKITNLPWRIDAAALRDRFGFEDVRLLNDLEALAWAVPGLVSVDVTTLQQGVPDPRGTLAVLAPGTGLGEAFVTRSRGGDVAHASEGGHADFAPAGELQERLLGFLREAFGHVSWERVCSGSGLPNIHRFLVESEGMSEVPAVTSRLTDADDATPILIEAALSGESPVCARVLRIFADALAAEAGNLALKVMATGGVFLGGGIPPRILPVLEATDFLETFRDKGRFAELLNRVPVHVVNEPQAVLRGAAVYGVRCWRPKESGE